MVSRLERLMEVQLGSRHSLSRSSLGHSMMVSQEEPWTGLPVKSRLSLNRSACMAGPSMMVSRSKPSLKLEPFRRHHHRFVTPNLLHQLLLPHPKQRLKVSPICQMNNILTCLEIKTTSLKPKFFRRQHHRFIVPNLLHLPQRRETFPIFQMNSTLSSF